MNRWVTLKINLNEIFQEKKIYSLNVNENALRKGEKSLKHV